MKFALIILGLLIPATQLFAREDILVLNETTPLLARNWSFQLSEYSAEREYEDGDIVLDQRDDTAWGFELTKGFIINSKLSTEIGFTSEFFGETTHKFNPTLNRDNIHFRYKGLRALKSRLIYRYQNSPAREQGILLEIFGLPWRGRDGRAGLGGLSVGASHLSRWKFASGLYTQSHFKVIFAGPKKIIKDSGGLERTDPYSLAEFQGTLGYLSTPWLFALTPGFGLSNDYNIHSNEYNRESDKGFSLHIKASVGYQFKSGTLTLSHTRRSEIFNNISDLPSDEIDFEIESNQTAMEYVWHF